MTFEQFHQRIWNILEPVDSASFQVVAAKAPGEQEIADIEALTGIPLPPEYVQFSQRTNGLCVMARDEVWPQAQLYSVAPAWTFWRGLVMLGIDAEDLPEWASIRSMYQKLAENGVTDVLPLLRISGDGDRVWGINLHGIIVEVDIYGGEVTPLEGDSTDLYASQIAELVQRL